MNISDIVLESHKYITQMKNKYVAVDATCGNGHDSIFLSSLFDLVYSFDIQELAIKRSSLKFKDLNNIKLFHDDFNNIPNYLKYADLFLFNLGFLPGSNKKIKTSHYTSAKAILNCYSILNPDGLIIICSYTSHEGGIEEFNEILNSLNKYNIIYSLIDNFSNNEKLIIVKKN